MTVAISNKLETHRANEVRGRTCKVIVEAARVYHLGFHARIARLMANWGQDCNYRSLG